MLNIMKKIYLTISVAAGMFSIASIECIVTSEFYIPIIALIVAALSFIASIPFFSERDWKILTNDDEEEEVEDIAMYKTCPYCGANLDPAEKCNCKEKKASSKMTPYEKHYAKVLATGNKWAIENFKETH